MEIKKNLTKFNFSDKNDISRIKFLVVHFFGDLADAKSVARYFADSYVGASAHYNIDESSIIYQSVEDADVAWHCGANTYFHPTCRNSNSIGIEVRPTKLNKNSKNADDNDWYFLDETLVNTIKLIWILMDKYNIPIENVIRHYDVTHKPCPRPFTGDDINSVYKVSGNIMWLKFKERIQNRSEVDEMDISKLTNEQVDQLIEKIQNRLSVKPISDYAVESSKKAVASGLFADGNGDGSIENPQVYLRRQDLTVVLNNAKIFDKK